MAGASADPSSIRYLRTRVKHWTLNISTRDDAFDVDDFLTDARHTKEGREKKGTDVANCGVSFPNLGPTMNQDLTESNPGAGALDRASECIMEGRDQHDLCSVLVPWYSIATFRDVRWHHGSSMSSFAIAGLGCNGCMDCGW